MPRVPSSTLRSAAIAWLCSWCLPGLAAQVPAALLERAGDNKAAIALAFQDVPAEQRAALQFLCTHMPDGDLRTLEAAFLRREVQQAHAARAAVPWGRELADQLFLHFVLPYAQANEAREDWRTDFTARFLPLVQDCKTPGEAALRLNASIFDLLKVHYSTGRARADQAPSASIAQGKASCTGLSILLADACRACCVPARLVSVQWPHKPGNHTWVEVWDGAAWRFVGADEPDPQGFDRAWFVGDATQCADADAAHRIYAVSFAATGQRFAAGWGRGIELWGEDVTARYARPAAPAAGQDPVPAAPATTAASGDAALLAQFDRFFAAPAERQATFEFDRNLDAELATAAGDARLRTLAAASWRAAERTRLLPDFEQKRVRAGDKESPFTWKQVGTKPAGGWGLVIAMHGGGGAPKRVNDSQWQHMQIYYQDHPEAGGYLYCALRAPTDEWNGFYTDYFYPLLETLIRQFVVCADVDPNRVIAIGYSHGGYGAFAIGPKLPHRFAAVHGSAAAPTDGETVATGLHSLRFSFMVGGRDTAYGRAERCQKFAAQLAELQQRHPGRYPYTFTFVEKNGHTGLPDRDLLKELVPLVRTERPAVLHWESSDGTVKQHYWLRCERPARGGRVDAALADGVLTVTSKDVTGLQAWFDARGLDFGRELQVVVDGTKRSVRPQPTLRTLCATLALEGDPVTAASWVLALQ
jgi:Transglutaminase-like superfamily